MEQLLKRCTQPLLRVFANAAQRALAEGNKTIEPSHLFFGLTDLSEINKKPIKKRTKKIIASVELSQQSIQLIEQAASLAARYSYDSVGPEHLFVSLLYHRDPAIQKMLEEHHVSTDAIKRQLVGIVDHTAKLLDLFHVLDHEQQHAHSEGHPAPQAHPSALSFFTTELTSAEHASSLDPVIGRDTEIGRMIRILARRTKNNPVLVGPPGVGKTAIVEGVAKRIVEGTVPQFIKDKKIYALNIPTLLSGAAMRGELEMRLSALIADIKKEPNAILFVDELHNLVGGGMHGSMDASEVLKPALARGTIRCIGATTHEDYKRWIEDDPAFERRFQPVAIEEPDIEETKQIIRGLLPRYEEYHGVTVSPDALDACVHLADRYITEKHFPDKAIDVIDEAAAKVKVEESSDRTITPSIINGIIASMTGISSLSFSHEQTASVLSLHERLAQRIVGQEDAVRTVTRALIRAQSGLVPKGRPRASFLFLGPSGVGKTELCRVLSAELFGDHALLKFDMSEFSESHTIARLIGAPSGYVGYKEGGRLTESVRKKPHSIILFDEAEKAHPRVLNVLLQILDDGKLTDSAGREVDFSNTIVVLTSNMGSEHWQKNGGTLGFVSESTNTVRNERVLADVRQWLSPEMLSRIDHTLLFNPLDDEHLRHIAALHLNELSKRLAELHVTLRWRQPLLDTIVKKSAAKTKGARVIRHTIEETIEDAIAHELVGRQENKPLVLTVSHGTNGTLKIRSTNVL